MQDQLVDQDNNFDVLRLFAASAVIFAHSWVLAGGAASEPYVRFPQGVVGGGALGVWMFFCISGYLVANSYIKRGFLGFVEARLLRIFPGLVAALLVGVFVGAMFTDLALASYFSHPLTLAYLFRGAVLDIQFSLPTLQQSTAPGEANMNGALWTLPLEAQMYMLVAVLGLFGFLRKRTLLSIFFIAGSLALFYYPMMFPAMNRNFAIAPVICFAFGVIFYSFRDRIKLSAVGSFFLLTLTLGIGYAQPKFKIVLYLAICYWTLWLAFHSSIKIRIPRGIGDVSYGLYIYHMPIQVVGLQLFPSATPIEVFFSTMAVAFFIAWVSWHFLEKRALALKGRGKALIEKLSTEVWRRDS